MGVMSGLDIYLDVDGVILPACLPDTIPYDGWRNHGSTDLTMSRTYSTDLVAAINTLAARRNVEVFWLTTWTDWAPERLPAGIGIHGADWPVLGVKEHLTSRGWWKFDAIKAHRRPRRQAIWLDDDIESEPDAVAWAAGQDDMHTVIPNAEVGVTRDEWREALAFADAATEVQA